MRAPKFWESNGLIPFSLKPLSYVWQVAACLRHLTTKPYSAPMPVLCIGNVVAGGAGKTPVALDLLQRLRQRGHTPWALTRGYGGQQPGPLLIDRQHHTATDVGDEALLLAEVAPTLVARNRPDGARLAAAHSAPALILDDGLQNPSLAKDLSLLVIDGAYGIGNGQIMPAGPLRESLSSAIDRCHAVIMIGSDVHGIASTLPKTKPILRARFIPDNTATFSGQRVSAFAGIGRPEKFAASLRDAGAEVVAFRSFADHHPYQEAEITQLIADAGAAKAQLVTTAKDYIRLPSQFRDQVNVFRIKISWDNVQEIENLLDSFLAKGARLK